METEVINGREKVIITDRLPEHLKLGRNRYIEKGCVVRANVKITHIYNKDITMPRIRYRIKEWRRKIEEIEE